MHPCTWLLIRSSDCGWGEHPGSLMAEPAAPSRGDAGFSSHMLPAEHLLAETHLIHAFGPSAVCYPRSAPCLAFPVTFSWGHSPTGFAGAASSPLMKIYKGARLQLRVPPSLPAAPRQECCGCNALPASLSLASPGCNSRGDWQGCLASREPCPTSVPGW